MVHVVAAVRSLWKTLTKVRDGKEGSYSLHSGTNRRRASCSRQLMGDGGGREHGTSACVRGGGATRSDQVRADAPCNDRIADGIMEDDTQP